MAVLSPGDLAFRHLAGGGRAIELSYTYIFGASKATVVVVYCSTDLLIPPRAAC